MLAMMLAAVAAGQAGQAPAEPPVPRVEFAFPRLIERYCSAVSPRPPAEEVMAEIARRLPELAAYWEREGPVLLEESRRVTGRPYHFAETQAVLHGCEDLTSMSQPLLIAAAPYTDAWERRPPGASGRPRVRRTDADFAYAVWHELTHRYISRVIAGLPGATTPSRERHAGEDIVVRNHLHLFALEELVWRRLGRGEEFEARRVRILALGDPELTRAYGIVAEEGAEALVAELRPGDADRQAR
jgi:hypothetical protein